jgi:hypothetical protein
MYEYPSEQPVDRKFPGRLVRGERPMQTFAEWMADREERRKADAQELARIEEENPPVPKWTPEELRAFDAGYQQCRADAKLNAEAMATLDLKLQTGDWEKQPPVPEHLRVAHKHPRECEPDPYRSPGSIIYSGKSMPLPALPNEMRSGHTYTLDIDGNWVESETAAGAEEHDPDTASSRPEAPSLNRLSNRLDAQRAGLQALTETVDELFAERDRHAGDVHAINERLNELALSINNLSETDGQLVKSIDATDRAMKAHLRSLWTRFEDVKERFERIDAHLDSTAPDGTL